MRKRLLFFLVLFSSASWLSGQYCTSNLYGNSGCSVGDYIDDFSLGSYSQSATGCGTAGYSDYTNDTITLTQTITNGLNVTTGFSSQTLRIWIDFNDDTDFDDPGEEIFLSPSTIGPGSPLNDSITLAAGTATGIHRMRARVVWSTTNFTACGNESFGEVHDYTVNVLPNVTGNCPAFTNILVDSISGTAAKVHWTQGTGNSSYALEYGPSGFTPGTGTTITGNYPTDSSLVILTGLNPQTNYDIRICEICNSGADSTCVTNPLSFSTTKLCASPTGFVASNINTTSVDLNWSQAGNAQEYWIIYGSAGFNPSGASANVDTSTTTSYTLGGLNPATSYDIYLATNCAGGNGVSDTVGPINILTLIQSPTGVNCSSGNPTTVFFDEFDNSTQFTGDISNSTGDWNFDNNSTGSSNTGPTGPYSGSHYIYFEASNSGPASMVSPVIPLANAVDSAELSFYLHAYGSDVGYLVVRASTSSANGPFNDTLFTLNGQLQQSSSDPWQQVGIRLDQYVGQNIWLEFEADRNGSFSGDIALDSLVIQACGTFCLPQIQSLSFYDLKQDSASFQLDFDTTAAFQYEWGPCGFSQGTGTISSDTTRAVIGGLAPNTCYEVYIRKDCGNINSPWTGPFSFLTACGQFTAPYSQDFDGTVDPEIENCWTPITATSSVSRVRTRNTLSYSSPNSLMLNNRNNSTGNVSVVSPSFSDLDSTKQIKFWVNDDDGSDLIIGTMSDLNDTSTFVAYDTITGAEMPDDTWQQYVITFENYTGTGSYIAFRHGMNTNTDQIFLDNFVYEFIPACVPPSVNSLGVSNLTSSSVYANWGSGSNGDTTEVTWGAPGFVPGFGLGIGGVPGAVDSFQITGLSPLTNYEFYVRDSCNSTGYSPWVGPFSFTTPVQSPVALNCFSGSPTTLLIDDFDNSTQFTGDISSSTGDWNFENSTTGSFATGPNGPLSGSHYIYFEGSGSGPATMQSPAINLSQASGQAQLSFWLHAFGDDIGYLAVTADVSSTGSFTDTLFSLNAEIQQSEADPWQQVGVDLSSYVGQTVYINFTADHISCCSGDIAIDSLKVEACGSFCLAPLSLNAVNIVDSAATLTWDAANNATNYEVWFGNAGFYQGTTTVGGARATSATNSFLVDTLTGQGCYEYLVRTFCASGDTSTWAGPFSFCTPCSPVQAPYMEDFDGLSASSLTGDLGNCWITSPDATGPFSWRTNSGTTGSSGTGPNGDATSGSGVYLYTEASSGSQGDQSIMESPLISLSGLSTVEMRFAYHMHGNNIDSLLVEVNDGTGWTQESFLFGEQQTANGDPWKIDTVNLNAYAGGVVKVRFRAIRGNGFTCDYSIDDFIIEQPVVSDLELVDAQFDKNSRCLNTNDTLVYSVANIKGSTYSMASDPLVLNYNVTGPINSSGSATISSGTINSGDTVDFQVTGIDMSIAGTYALNASIGLNNFNLSTLSDTLNGASSEIVRAALDAKPDTVVIINNTTDTVNLAAESSFFSGSGFMITEVCHYAGFGTGGPTASWVPDDYIEITGIPGSDLDGYTLEQWENGSMDGSFTFGPGTVLSPSGVATIAIGSGNTSDPANYLYDGRGNAGTWSSGGEAGRILKDPSGNIVDAVGYPGNTSYTFPASSGVTAADWSGNTPAANGTAGIRLEGPDANNASNWVVVSSGNLQDPGVVNTNVQLPAPSSIAGFNWSLNGAVVDTMPETVVGPYTVGGVYNYIATYNGPCGVLTDTVVVVVNLPGFCPTPSNLNANVLTCDSIELDWTNAADTTLVWNVPAGSTPGSSAITVLNDSSYTVVGTTPNTAYDFYVANICDGDTGAIAGPISYNTDSVGEPGASFIYTQPSAGLVVNFDASATTGQNNTYAWDFGDGNLGTGITTSHTYAAGGNYSVTLTVTNSCGVDDTTLVLADISRTENALAQSLELFPNPTRQVVNINFDTFGNSSAEIKVMDLSGKVIMVKSETSINGRCETKLNVSDLASGTYMIEIISGSLKANHRLIKK